MSRIGDWFRRPTLAARLDLIVQSMQKINVSASAQTVLIEQINLKLQVLERMEKAMSQLSDAVAALTAANEAEHQELQLVLAAVHDFPAKIQVAIDQAIAAGADPATLAAIQAAKDQQVADTQAMVDALAATPATWHNQRRSSGRPRPRRGGLQAGSPLFFWYPPAKEVPRNQ